MPSRVTLYTDLFNRANNPDLGAEWDAGYTLSDPAQINDNGVLSTTGLVTAIETVNAVSLPADQWVEAELSPWDTVGTHLRGGLLLRSGAGPAVTHYAAIAGAGTGSWTTRIEYRLTGVLVDSVEESATTWAPSDLLRFEAIGSAMVAYRNGVALPITLNNGALSGGRCGLSLVVLAGAVSTLGLDNLSAGGFVGGGGVLPRLGAPTWGRARLVSSGSTH